MIDSTFWRTIRQDFEALEKSIAAQRQRDLEFDGGRTPAGFLEFTLTWSTNFPVDPHTGKLAKSKWGWVYIPDDGLRIRIEALAKRAAKGLGLTTEDDWFDILRCSPFVAFVISGTTTLTGPYAKPYMVADGVTVKYEMGKLRDIVTHSITSVTCLRPATNSKKSEHASSQTRNPWPQNVRAIVSN